jgi:O-methyltransferase
MDVRSNEPASPSGSGTRHADASELANMSRSLYLELLKSCLLDDIYGSTVSEEQSWRQWRAGARAKPREVLAGKYWPSRAHTMIGRKRLDNIQLILEKILEDDIEGDLIETGVWRGGATIFMRGFLKAHKITDRIVYAADSFAGLPPPDPKYSADEGDRHHAVDFLKVSMKEVKENFGRYGLLDEQVTFIKGLFRDTLPHAPIEKLALLRLDGDMYGSTMEALDALYDKLSPGGYVIVDDYGALKNCKAAVDDFRTTHHVAEPISKIDWSGVYWRKMPL